MSKLTTQEIDEAIAEWLDEIIEADEFGFTPDDYTSLKELGVCS